MNGRLALVAVKNARQNVVNQSENGYMAEPETTIDLLTIKARPGSGFYEIFCIFANMSCLCIHLVRLFNLPCKNIFVIYIE